MFDVNMLINTFGFIGVLVIIFMETGMLIGFIFPGDTLLFTAGILAAQPHPFAHVWQLMLTVPLAAIAGDQVGFLFGRKVGPRVLESRAMTWMGPRALDRTHHFFDRFGAPTVMLARFIGVVRTLTPVVAGVSGMKHRTFTLWSVIGSTIWGAGVIAIGYWLGGIPLIDKYVHWFIILGLLSVVIPALFKATQLAWRKHRSNWDQTNQNAQGTQDAKEDSADVASESVAEPSTAPSATRSSSALEEQTERHPIHRA
ncbi:DedA family protein [Corynebacterium sp. MC-04]|uniref:DedA family protein n=2 Tax=Corynebacterium parakroppenstedtii TaxID=2828363 RepID=A0ABS9HIA0_9CORY|nr:MULTISPECIES: DedA family protein [Corynebacterium]KXB51063.1 SNARE-like domain protein [Corynebacterium kroppenstedtii]MBY0791697.1 DedA family protein [Corynebacterium parakroppenstedtii]MCF6768650.1 DedA family protein [Corynebacterium parakroppenstedtii]MCF6771490.1 DedA family protein [Corynebacterium parakroppenstedtii]MCF6773583.1 DedA family protein [Corynebacterium parakroppenstedtii]